MNSIVLAIGIVVFTAFGLVYRSEAVFMAAITLAWCLLASLYAVGGPIDAATKAKKAAQHTAESENTSP